MTIDLDLYLPAVMEEAGRVATTVWVFPWMADGLHKWMLLIRTFVNW